MNENEIKIKKQLIQKRSVVKQNLKALKDEDIIQEQSFFPITKRLQTIAEKLDAKSNTRDLAKKEEKLNFSFSSPKENDMQNKRPTYFDAPSFLDYSIIAESTANDNDITDEGNADDDKELGRNMQDAKECIRDMRKYDRKSYLNIVKRTNTNKRNYSEDDRIQGNGSYKYKNIISALTIQPLTSERPPGYLNRRRLGLGMLMVASNNPIDYVHWNDPNQLVDRLRLLVSSQTVGHTGHNNEIASVIEELRESEIIE